MTNELKEDIISNGKVIKKWSRWTGTGYKSSIVEYKGKTYQINYNCHSQEDGFFHSVNECEDPRPSQKEYFLACLKAAKENDLPVEVVMALGVRNSELTYFNCIIEGIAKSYLADSLHELISCGIARRKKAIKEVIKTALENSDVSDVYYFEDLIDRYNSKIESMGQVNSERIATFLAEKISEVKSWEF
jgi:hypothetical protein